MLNVDKYANFDPDLTQDFVTWDYFRYIINHCASSHSATQPRARPAAGLHSGYCVRMPGKKDSTPRNGF